MATLDHASEGPGSRMHHLFKTCPDVTCGHTVSSRLHQIEKTQRDTGFQIADIHRFEAVVDELKKQIRKLDFENKDFQKDIASLEQVNKAHEQEKDGQTRTIDNLHTTLADLRKKLAKAGDGTKREKQRKEHENALAKAHKEGEANRKKCEALKKASVELEKDNSELRKSRDEAANKARESEIKIEELIAMTEKASAVAKKRLLEDGRKIKEAEQQAETGRTKIMDLETKSLQFEQQAATNAATMKRLENQLSNAGKKASTDQMTIEQLNTQLLDMSQKRSADEAKVKRLEAQIFEQTEHLNTLREALQEEKNRNEIFKQESEDHKQKTTDILAHVQGYIFEAINSHIQDHNQDRDPLRGQGQPEQTAGYQIQSPDTGYESSLHTNTAGSTPIAHVESKPTSRENHAQLRPYSPEGGETDRSRIAFTPRQQIMLAEPRREREIPPFTLPPPKSSPVAGTNTQDLRNDPALKSTPPRGPRRSTSQHPDGENRGTPRRRQDSGSQRGWDSYRPGDS
ncbi:hypothetical protein LTR84_001169 [Exophiala bonariae]|uniref:Uncharacterized protein n=1 Tax=Exophiala bonariae TaxID=1690606 RepID=A0AAV9NSM8_9EURO|nr:hypothetical protein LTR84_001169 [Exophiala bonariae]